MRIPILIGLSVILLAAASSSDVGQSDTIIKSVKLSDSEKRALNTSVPRTVRTFLETADDFVIFAQLEVIDGKLQAAMNRELVPNFKAVIKSVDKRNKVLKALYTEASKDHGPAICYLPSHSIVAQKGNQAVTIEICFGCRRFYISGALGKSEGTFALDGGDTERMVTDLVAELGVTTK